MSIKQIQKNKGFTLIEMLVSIALFSVVLTVCLGSILTIADSNKKSRSLMSVTNNLNFAVDSMVRSFKSGDVNSSSGFVLGDCFITKEAVFDTDNIGDDRSVEYCFRQNTGQGKITKTVAGGTEVDLTSSDVNIEYAEFKEGGGTQPLLIIILKGTVKVSEKISSTFSIQTSVSQRKLEII